MVRTNTKHIVAMGSKNLQSSFLGSGVCSPASTGQFSLKRKVGNPTSVKCALVVDGGNTLVSNNVPSGISSLIVRRPLAKRKVETTTKEREIGLGNNGKFGRYGGRFVPETLISCLSKLEAEFKLVLQDPVFQVCVAFTLLITNTDFFFF